MRKKSLLSAITALFLFYSSYAVAFTLTTDAWQADYTIPVQYTCDGKNISPSLDWTNPPAGTQSLALIMNDPDAPSGNWTHWVLFNIPAAIHHLSTNLTSLPTGTQAGKNSWGYSRYDGPCPPNGEHHYVFNLYALDVKLDLKSNTDLATLQKAMANHIAGSAKLAGRYQRNQRNK